MFQKYGLTKFDATGAAITLNFASQPVDHIRNVLTIITADGFPNYRASPPRSIPQLSMPVIFADLDYFVTSQEVRTPKIPTTTPNFTRTPGCVNPKIVIFKTKAGEVLYKRATMSLYPDSEVKFALTSEGLLTFAVLVTGHAKSYGWKKIDVTIATIVSIK